MKNKIILYLLAIVFIGSACQESILDREPLDKIAESAVFTSAPLIDANLNRLYADTYFRYHGSYYIYEDIREMLLGGELRDRGNWYGQANYVDHQLMDETRDGIVPLWQYSHVRNINEFIEKLTAAEDVAGMDDELKAVKLAEARFLRAFTYFEMSKRYGAVPLITEAQKIPESETDSSLYVSRNAEKEIYEFIEGECNAIAPVLLEPGAMGNGRVHKYAVWAFKARAMLYAASIAKNGTQQLNGLLGFPASEAQSYYQKAYDAAKEVANGGYALYSAESDKTTNYQMLFLDEDNVEVIFSEKFNGLDKKGHNWSLFAWPGGASRVGWGAEAMPYLETALVYDYINGKSGMEDRALLESDEKIDFVELWKDKDPRFHASMLYPGAMFAGYPVYAHDGTYVEGELNTEQEFVGEYNGFDWFAKSPWSRFHNRTGFTIKKFLNEPLGTQVKNYEDDVDRIIFRYAEILLITAETALELNKPGEALDAINQIRERAGMPALTSVTFDDIIHERDVELMFENHKYWDYRRWRIAETKLSEPRGGMQVYFDWDTKKYEVNVLDDVDRRIRYFGPQHYYMPIKLSRISNNPNLAPENPGYN
ncbi:MAG: RagB/SusD family nutrient uptake outer membrane protein [Bacteroidota bacterium]